MLLALYTIIIITTICFTLFLGLQANEITVEYKILGSYFTVDGKKQDKLENHIKVVFTASTSKGPFSTTLGVILIFSLQQVEFLHISFFLYL
jgi:hypothetical protein